MVAGTQSKFDPAVRIEQSKFDDYSTAVDYYIKHDSESALKILEIIKNHPKIDNKNICQQYLESRIGAGWDPSVFKVPSNRREKKNTLAYKQAVNAILTELFMNGYVTSKKRAQYEILKRGTEALESGQISIKGNSNLGQRVVDITKNNPGMSDNELNSIYSVKYGFEPDEHLQAAIIESRNRLDSQNEQELDFGDEGDFDEKTKRKLWAIFHEEYFKKIAEFKDNRKELRKIANRILIQLGVSLSYGEGYPENDIDPFTLISKITALDKNKFEKRKKGYELLKEEFNLQSTIPSDNNGVPKQVNQNSVFSFRTDLSWELFESAMNYKNKQSNENRNRFIKAFNSIVDGGNSTWVKTTSATMALFWMDPYFFPTIDSKTRPYLLNKYGIEIEEEITGEKYLSIIEEIRKMCPDKDFRLLSREAWEYDLNVKKIFKQRNNESYSFVGIPLDDLSDEAKVWLKILSDSKVSSPLRISMLVDFAKNGGSASYKELSNETGLSINEYESNLVSYGKAVYKEYKGELNITVDKKHGYRYTMFDCDSLPSGANWRENNVWTLKPALLEVLNHICDLPMPLKSEDKGDLNLIFYGPPGSGKTFSAKNKAVDIVSGVSGYSRGEYIRLYKQYCSEGKIKFITFHQSYSYEDFICGIFPSLNRGDLSYKIRIGSFLGFCYPLLQKRLDEGDGEVPSTEVIEGDYVKGNKVIIIDEINRGNVSSIFGELMTLIERSKRLNNEDESRASVPSLGVEIGIPDDIHILGTMNTADKSLVYLDAALRRRFRFIEKMPDDKLVCDFGDVKLKSIFNEINRRIEIILDRDHVIGHSEFIGIRNIDDLRILFSELIIPLLQDYFFEDYSKIIKVLSKKGKPDESDFITEEIDNTFFEDRKVYKITNSDKWNSSTFNRLVDEA